MCFIEQGLKTDFAYEPSCSLEIDNIFTSVETISYVLEVTHWENQPKV